MALVLQERSRACKTNGTSPGAPTAPALNSAYDDLQAHDAKLSVREMLAMMRSPEFAGVMRALDTVLRTQKGHRQ